MNGSLVSVKTIALICVLSFYFASCGGSQTTLSSGSTTSGTETTDDTTPASGNTEGSASGTADVPDGFTTSTEFFVAVDGATTYPFYSSVLNSFSTACKITSGTTPAQDMYCVVEAPELSFYNGGVMLDINTPAGMCAYTKVVPYWYYNMEVGVGPSSIEIESNTVDDAEATFRCGVNGAGLGSCGASFDEVSFGTPTAPAPVCVYDTSAVDGGQNCCFGTYTLTTTTNVTTSGVLTTTVTSETKSWGGDKDKGVCVGGQGKTNWENFSKSGLPVADLYETRTSSTPLRYVVTAPIKTVKNSSNIPLVNYFTSATIDPTAAVDQHSHAGFSPLNATTSVFPYYVAPISDRSGSAISPSGSPYYEVQCLNDAHETIHRIRVLLREWDTKAEYDDFITNAGVYAGTKPWDIDPAWLGGDEGADCSGLSPEICNDMEDADNFVYGQSGNDYSTGAGNKSERTNYFLKHEYIQ